ncbi:MAG: hypothetical protein Q4A01_05200 [Coriobacteriales bacterium]|nr:hypothetical protein [Coriobacteriales bacterium]
MSIDEQTIDPEDEPLSENIRNIVGGVATLVLLCVPLLLIHTLRKRIESGDTFKKIEQKLG